MSSVRSTFLIKLPYSDNLTRFTRNYSGNEVGLSQDKRKIRAEGPRTGKTPLPPKLTAPRLKNTLVRERLLTRLDQLCDQHAVIWISAPAGSGKTTLVGDDLAQHKRRCLWYQIDEGDNDVASFFITWGWLRHQACTTAAPFENT